MSDDNAVDSRWCDAPGPPERGVVAPAGTLDGHPGALTIGGGAALAAALHVRRIDRRARYRERGGSAAAAGESRMATVDTGGGNE